MNTLVKNFFTCSFAQPLKMLRSDFGIFLLGVLIYRSGWFMTLPFMAIYLYKVLGAGPVAIGLVLGVGPLVACLTGFIAGSLVDRFGAKSITLISAFCSALIFVLFCFSRNLFFYGALNIGLGIFRSFIETAAPAYIAHVLPAEQRSKGLSLRYMTINLSAAIGPLIGARVILLSAQTLFLTAAVIYFVTFLGFCFSLKSIPLNKTPQTSYWNGLRTSTLILMRDKIAIAVFFIEFFLCITFATMEINLPQILAARAVPHYIHVYSWLLVINAMMIVILQLPIDRLINKHPLQHTSYISVILFVISLIGFAYSYQTYQLIICTILFGIAEITGVTLCNIIIARIAPLDLKGVYFGIITLGMLGFSFGGIGGGAILKYFNGTVLFNAVALLAVACFAYLFVLPRDARLTKS